jgi:hypothetical protein
MSKKYNLLIAGLATAVILTGCDAPQPSSTQIERKQQEQLSLQGVQQVGMPSIINFAEKRMMKDILEIRDQDVATTTYIVDLNGGLHKLCNSIGYGLPYATQFTNPQRIARSTETPEHGNITLPQADPNGLYSPASADGTWVQCVDSKSGKAKVVYIEPRIIVSPIPLG